VLRGVLTEPLWAETVAGRISAEHFTAEAHLGIAAALLGNNGAGAASAADRAQAVRSDPGNAEAVSALLIDETPLSEEGLGECVALLERQAKQRRAAELRRALEAGELDAEGALQEELRRLLGELGGRQRRED
jgi:hypothetical protein